ncbi:MAG: transcription termination/antitermination protein NusA [Bacteroidales bacterium]|nr:transcription termination/antitermination protein NusA [Bacteroidales bacterium]MCR4931447.1 transcription termination factor NusA [Bacteroidales bacterium]
MKTSDLIDSFSEFKDFKNIDRETLMHILEEVFRTALSKKYGTDDNFDIIVNIDKGDLEIYRNRLIVEDGKLTDSKREIEYSEAIKIESDFEVGEDLSEPVPLSEFGRREILAIHQNLVGKIQDYEKSLIFQKYKDKVGEIVIGEVYQPWNKEILVLDEEKIELVLPKSEQIPSDRFRKGDTVRAIVLKVELKNNNPVIILSRTSPIFLERLLEAEVPEIYDGLITIRNIVRVPGERAKVAVESYDDRIDPVGSCVGMKGNRIHGIVRELKNENIDVINYSSRPELMIRRSLSPAEITKININEATKTAEVFMEPDQVSLAIGKGGHNIKLASKLCGYEIEIYRNTDEDLDDIDLKGLKGEIDDWVIDELIKIGCDTAKSVLALPKDELISRTDLEEETIDQVIEVLKALFDVDLKEFNDEIDQSVINALMKIGCDTAKKVLALPKKELVSRTGLDEETIDHVVDVLNAEFEEE